MLAGKKIPDFHEPLMFTTEKRGWEMLTSILNVENPHPKMIATINDLKAQKIQLNYE